MALFNLFSKRQRALRGDIPDVYTYDDLPEPLRVQIVHIIRDAFGRDYFGEDVAAVYESMQDTLCREYGVFELTKYAKSKEESVLSFFLQEESTEKALDVVELSFRIINRFIRDNAEYAYRTRERKLSSDEAINELNFRFKEHGIGYQFESNDLIRIDSDFLHAEAVKPVLTVLRGKAYQGANEEFLFAHEHYRHKRYKESVVNALKAFESTMKTICALRNWPTQPNDTAKNLIATCVSNGLFPSYLESQFGSLRSLLESGIPTVRNKNGGHGQGLELVEVPDYLARYVLNMTATSVLFLVEANNSAS